MIIKRKYPVYQKSYDLTFVMVDEIENNELVSIECIGWHFGEPWETEEYKKYDCNLKAIFE